MTFNAVPAMLAALATLGPTATPPVPPTLAPTGQWKVDLIGERCVLTRDFGPPAAQLMIAQVPGDTTDELSVGLADAPKEAPKGLGVVIVRDETTAAQSGSGGAAGPLPVAPLYGVRAYAVPHRFLTMIGANDVISIRTGTLEIVRLAPRNLPAAMTALARCGDTLLTKWGIDPAKLALAHAPPVPISEPSAWFDAKFYPNLRLLNEEGVAFALVRYVIDPQGRVSDCAIVKSSGSSAVDRASCLSLIERGRYRPALDARGAAIAVPAVLRIRWIRTIAAH